MADEYIGPYQIPKIIGDDPVQRVRFFDALATAINNALATVKAESVAEASWRRGDIPTDKRNIDAWTTGELNGWYDVPTMTIVDSIKAAGGVLPVNYPGVLIHQTTANGIHTQTYKSYGDYSGLYYRATALFGSGTWGAWQKQDADRGAPKTTENIDTWRSNHRNGTWDIHLQSVLNGIIASGSTLPVQYPGRLTHETTPNGLSFQTYKSYEDNAAIWFRASKSYADLSFKPWTMINTERGRIPTGTNIDTWFTADKNGYWDVPQSFLVNSIVAAGSTLPVVYPGRLFHESTDNGLTRQKYWSYGPNEGEWYRTITAYESNAFTPWKKVGDVPAGGNHQRAVRISEFKRRRGGRIGVQDKAVVTFIFDHGSNNMASKVMPLMRTHGFPCTFAINSMVMYDPTHFRYPFEDQTTWAMIQDWALKDGLEPYNHGGRHQAYGTVEAITQEVVGGRDELAANLPKLAIEGWVQIGASSDPDGFGDGNPLSAYWETATGQIILDNHAVVTGVRPGTLHTMSGEPVVGFSGTWIDSTTTTAQALISQAVTLGAGVVVRLHPEHLDTTGKLTTAQLSSFMEYVAGLRDAGKLDVLSASGFALADSSTSWRQNAIGNPGFTSGASGWNTTGAVSGSGVTLNAGQYIEQVVPVGALQAIGTVRELAATVSSAGGATLTMTVVDTAASANLSTSASHTLPSGTASRVVRDVLTIPFVGTPNVRVRFTVTAGSAVLSAPRLTAS